MAIFCQKNQIIPNFFAESHQLGCIFSKKINNLYFRHFLQPPPSGVIFGQFCHLTPTPWVTPPGQPLTYLPLCFLCPTSPKKMLDHENLTAFAIFQSGGWVFNFGLFGLFWPTLSEPGSPRVAQKCPTMVSPCYTHGTPCPNIRRACSINFVQFLNTPMFDTCCRMFYH